MKRLILALLLLLPTLAYAGDARMLLAVMSRGCGAFTDTGDSGSYLSNWNFVNVPCNVTYYYAAHFLDVPDNTAWVIEVYSDAEHTTLIASGSGPYIGEIALTGTITGVVTTIDGGEGSDFTETGTVYRGQTLADWTSKPPAGTALRTDGHWSVNGLVGAWAFNEGSGTVSDNLAGSSNDGTIGANVSWVSDGVSVASGANVPIGTMTQGTEFTLIGAVNPGAAASSDSVIGFTSGSGFRWLAIDSANQVRFLNRKANGSTIYDLTVNSAVTGNTWYTLAATHSETAGGVVYKDGSSIASSPATGTENGATWTGLIAGTANRNLTGTLRWVYYYNRALNSTEISSLTANPYQIFAQH